MDTPNTNLDIGNIDSEMFRNKAPRLLACVRKTANIQHSCAEVELKRDTVYGWRNVDPVFKAALADARNVGIAAMEEEYRRRSFDGLDEPVYYLGEVVGYVKKFTDRGAEFLLRANDPEKFRERVDITHSGPVEVVVRDLVAENRARRDAEELI